MSGGLGDLAAGLVRLLSALGLDASLGPVLGFYVVVGLLLAVVRRAQSVNTARLCFSFAAHLRSDLFGASNASTGVLVRGTSTGTQCCATPRPRTRSRE